jgi:CcmD family protein
LIRRRGRERLKPVNSLGYLAAVNVVIWVGLFLYLWRLDRRISESELRETKK